MIKSPIGGRRLVVAGIAATVVAAVGLGAVVNGVGPRGAAAPTVFHGYVEGEYARLAPREGGILEDLRVQRGDSVKGGDVVAILEHGDEQARLLEARARAQQTEAQLANLRKGKRTPEIEALNAQLRQAQAALKLSDAQYRRQRALPKGQVVSEDKLDQMRSAFERDRGRVAELTADIEVARLAARDDEIAAAEAAVAAARAQVAQAEWRLSQRTLIAPADARVADTLFVVGEHVAAGAPVVSLLAPGNVKVRFFVPEPLLASIKIGQEVSVRCDGCADGLTAKVGFVAPEAEYTPPVIYSRESRAKLVFMIEARPEAGAVLHPGQPVEVTAKTP